MKIAVYAICKNEEKFVTSFLESCKDADLIAIADTGSTDNTVERFIEEAKRLGIGDKLLIQYIHIFPWRFDDARNTNLAMIPPEFDVCVCLDLDEILSDGWRKAIEEDFTKDVTRLRYFYTWNWNEDGSPGVTYWGDKVHKRIGYRWTMPCHEVLTRDSRCSPECQVYSNKLKIEHHPDDSKSRTQYLPLLKLAVDENPQSPREVHYYARELMNYGLYLPAILWFNKYFELNSKDASERCASYRYLGRCHWALKQKDSALIYFNLATQEKPDTREPWLELALAYRGTENWIKCKEAIEKCLSIKEKSLTYASMPTAWSEWPEKILEETNKNLSNSIE